MFSLGFLNSACAFIIGVTNLHGPIFESVIPKVVKALQRISIN